MSIQLIQQYFRAIPRKEAQRPTIAEKFNTYRLAEYKESVIELLGRVCTVSVETIPCRAHMKIVREMGEKEEQR